MAEQKEKILIEINTNLDKVIEETAKYKNEIDELKERKKQLQKAEGDHTKEIVAIEAEIKRLTKEYNANLRQIEATTAAVNANEGSYKQLYNAWIAAEAELKKQAGLLKRNEDGTIELTEAYIKAKEEVDKAKTALLEFNDGIKDGRLNVGNYKQGILDAVNALREMPEPLGSVASGVQSLGEQLKMLMANPIVALIAAITAGLMGLYKAFTSSDEGADKFSEGLAYLKGLIQPIINAIKDFAEALFSGDFKKAGEQILNFLIRPFKMFYELANNAWGAIKALFSGNMEEFRRAVSEMGDNIITGVTGINKEMRNQMAESAKAMMELKRAENELEDATRDLGIEMERNNYISAKMETIARDSTKSASERLRAASEAIAAERRNLEIKMELAKKEEAIAKKRINLEGGMKKASEESINALAEARKKLYQIQTEFEEGTRKLVVKANELKAEIEATSQERAEKEEMLARAPIEAIKNKMPEIEDVQKEMANKISSISEESAKQDAEMAKELELKKWNDRVIIAESGMRLLSGIEAMGDAFGRKSAQFRKALGLAQLSVDTGIAIAKGIATSQTAPFPANIAAIITTVGAILTNIASAKKFINEAKIPGGDSGGGFSGASLSINSSIPKMEEVKTENIKESIKRIPAPIVTVEDINAKQEERIRVLNLANI